MLAHRPVRESDLPQIVEFVQSARELFDIYPAATYPFTVDQLKQTIVAGFESTVILQDNDIVGFANFYALKAGDWCGIGNLIVCPDKRNQGVGTYLVRTMINIAMTKHKVKTISISCFADNFASLMLYTKLGFKPEAIDSMPAPDGNGIPRINFKLESGINIPDTCNSPQ